ncbi:hypothetical protein [Enterovibrio coralii]|uniref:Uncharacterized protein n=1 Tax=Enterovibrio coralii TaxID=294935 RepID=A0A135I731_9GAMM|nr:hypothetical protein [Enterovibrio coralii]KXF81194.1 hypothetical protein ATN88_00010 [Enterovibrio coralii]
MIGLITSVIGLVGGYFKDRQTIKARKQARQDKLEEAITTAQTRRIEQGDANAAELDRLSIAQRGWKDEYLLILTTLPVLLAFVPSLAPYVGSGFHALADNVPEYYWYALALIYIDTFGFRRMLRVAIEHWLAHKTKGTLNG